MIALKIFVFISIIAPLNYLCAYQCAHAEYEVNNQCCPMCNPGNHVFWHCTDDTSTTCVSCPALTFIDEPNGLMECFPCSVCDASRGLRVSKACSRSSDTVCGPLERFYCIDKKKSSCTSALKHSECRLGQYIKQAGTASTDTVCADCPGDTFSNGSFSSCLPHSKCEAVGLAETNPGTNSSDTECGNPPTSSTYIFLSVLAILLLIGIVLCVLFVRFRKKEVIQNYRKQRKQQRIKNFKVDGEGISLNN